MTESEIRERVKSQLSTKRFAHVEGVVAAADELAQRFGVSPERARLAGWVHDFAREWPLARLHKFAEEGDVPAGFATIAELLHGPIAANLLPSWFGIQDAEIADAVRYHTTGRLGMSTLEQVVCLADAIEPNRRYDGVEEIRLLAKTDLKRALVSSLYHTLYYLLATEQPIFPLTVMVRNELWEDIRAIEGANEQKTIAQS